MFYSVMKFKPNDIHVEMINEFFNMILKNSEFDLM